jgi:glyoxylase-like metal-dependent hydrolase (beta-lactamase superfamily II)
VTLTRRDFLASTAAAAVAGAIGRGATVRAWQQQPAPLTPLFVPIRRNIGYFTCRGGTIGYLINSGGVAVVDSQYPDSAILCIDGLNTRSDNRKIDVLFNTHHHADHTGGNAVFKLLARKIVANRNVPPLQAAAAARAATPGEQVYATTTFNAKWRTSVGDETIAASFYAPAHTGGDSVVHFEKGNVVHVGDLVWNRLQTFVDRPGGASATHWITMVERIAAAYPKDATYVFGHAGQKGQVTGTRTEVLMMRDYLTALVEFVRAGIKAGKSRDEIVNSREVLKNFEDFGPLTTRALEGTYDELAAG